MKNLIKVIKVIYPIGNRHKGIIRRNMVHSLAVVIVMFAIFLVTDAVSPYKVNSIDTSSVDYHEFGIYDGLYNSLTGTDVIKTMRIPISSVTGDYVNSCGVRAFQRYLDYCCNSGPQVFSVTEYNKFMKNWY